MLLKTLKRVHNITNSLLLRLHPSKRKLSTSITTKISNKNNHPELSDLLNRLCIKHGMMGCSCSIIINGDYNAFNYGFGYADVDNPKSKLTPQSIPKTLFRVASLTKPMTATAVGLIINNPSNNYTYNSTIYSIIEDHPEILQNFRNFTTLNKYMDVITIKDLLCHQAGLRHYVTENDYFYENYNNNVLNMFGNDPLISEPGTSYNYTVYGYQLLGVLIECMSNTPYFEYIKRQILDPMGMNYTFPAGLRTKELPMDCQRAKQYVRTFRKDDKGYKRNISCVYHDKYSSPYFDHIVGTKYASGGFISSAADMAKFGYKCVIENKWGMKMEDMFYGHSVVDEMADKYYGYGWFMDSKQQPNELWHFGGPLGGYAYLKVIKHLNMSICVLANLQSTDVEQLVPYIEDYFMSRL